MEEGGIKESKKEIEIPADKKQKVENPKYENLKPEEDWDYIDPDEYDPGEYDPVADFDDLLSALNKSNNNIKPKPEIKPKAEIRPDLNRNDKKIEYHRSKYKGGNHIDITFHYISEHADVQISPGGEIVSGNRAVCLVQCKNEKTGYHWVDIRVDGISHLRLDGDDAEKMIPDMINALILASELLDPAQIKK